MSSWRQGAPMQVIKAGRKLFANTPVQKLPVITSIYRKVFLFGNAADEITADFRSIKLTVPNNDTTIVPGLVGGFYEKIELDVFERLAAISETIVDVGANIGLYCCLAAKQAKGSAMIIAFEPIDENLKYLRQNIEQNNQASLVVVEGEAVGESDGKIDIFLVEGQIGTHSPSAKNALGSTNSVSVPVITLDSYAAKKLQNPVDMLKVDVEGYEGSVLRGAKRMLCEDKPTLFVEFVPFHLVNCGFSPNELLDTIFDSYDHVFLVDEPRASLKRCSRKDLLDDGGGYKNANLIAVSDARKDHLSAVEAVGRSLKRA